MSRIEEQARRLKQEGVPKDQASERLLIDGYDMDAIDQALEDVYAEQQANHQQTVQSDHTSSPGALSLLFSKDVFFDGLKAVTILVGAVLLGLSLIEFSLIAILFVGLLFSAVISGNDPIRAAAVVFGLHAGGLRDYRGLTDTG